MIIMEREIPQEIRMVISWNRRILTGRITTAMETTIKIIPDLIIREVPEITIQTIMEITEITLVPKIRGITVVAILAQETREIMAATRAPETRGIMADPKLLNCRRSRSIKACFQ